MNKGIVDMTHTDSLIINAMLASYASEENKSYLDLVEPFVIYALPRKKKKIIDIAHICTILSDNFGLNNVQSKVIEKILINLSNKEKPYVKAEKKRTVYTFYVEKIPKITDFEKRKQEMKSLVSDVINALMCFADSNRLKKIKQDDAKSLLITFLKTYSAESYADIKNIENITLKEHFSTNNHLVARFILEEYNNELGCFDKIKQIHEGYFASIALYYFFDDLKNIENNTLKGTRVFLDTMLLVDALQLNTKYKANSMKELLSLIIDNGGTLYTFDYYFDELCGIINRYLKHPESRIFLDLEKFRREKTNISKIVLFLKHLKDEKDSKGSITLPFDNIKIEIIELASYDKLVEELSWHINVEELTNIIINSVKYTNGENDPKFQNDYNSIENILYDKKIKKTKSIFVSTNNNLIFAAKKYSKNNHIFYTDIDLASMLWLSNYSPKNNLSELVLLQNAYAAIHPSKEVLDEAIRIIENSIKSSDESLKEQALLLRYDSNLLYYISSVTENNKNNITPDFPDQLMTYVQNKANKDFEEKHQAQMQEMRENDEKLKKLDKAIKMQKNKFKFLSKCVSGFFTSILAIITYSIIFGVVFVLLRICSRSLIKGDYINNIYQLITLFSFVLSFVPFFVNKLKTIKKIYNIMYNYFYDQFCTHSILLNSKDTD